MKLNIKITDDNLERDGAWIPWQLDDNIKVRLTRFSTIVNQEELQRLLKKNRKALRNDKLQREIMTRFLCTHIIKDWTGLTDEVDGEEIEFKYSMDNAAAALNDSEDFYNWVMTESQNIINFVDYDDDDDTTLSERGEELKK